MELQYAFEVFCMSYLGRPSVPHTPDLLKVKDGK